MANKDVTVWGIHAGKAGEADALFLKKNVVALDWHKVGDLSELEPDREAFKAAVLKGYPDMKLGSLPVMGGQIFRFMHEMKSEDIVVYPSKHDRKVNIGRVEGDYEYAPGVDSHFRHQHPVRWIQCLPRTSFSQGALSEIGCRMTLFQVSNHANEFIAALPGIRLP